MCFQPLQKSLTLSLAFGRVICGHIRIRKVELDRHQSENLTNGFV